MGLLLLFTFFHFYLAPHYARGLRLSASEACTIYISLVNRAAGLLNPLVHLSQQAKFRVCGAASSNPRCAYMCSPYGSYSAYFPTAGTPYSLHRVRIMLWASLPVSCRRLTFIGRHRR